jgi:hypothetical protein
MAAQSTPDLLQGCELIASDQLAGTPIYCDYNVPPYWGM